MSMRLSTLLGSVTLIVGAASPAFAQSTRVYDNLHRLTNAIGLWGSYGYSYDPLNNLRARTGPSGLICSYDASNRLSGIGGAQSRTYAYNARGEVTGDGIRSFSLDADGQITGITGIATYAYDGNGRRIRSTAPLGVPEYALYGLGGDLVYAEKGGTQTDYLKLAGHTLVALRKTGGVTTPVYLHPDLLGSPRKATNAAGAPLWQEHFDPYGTKLNGVDEKLGYTGHVHDPESGYTYLQARFYDPRVGRFLSTDPSHFEDDNPFTFNRYGYANNNPYRYTDPDGRVVLPSLIPAAVMAWRAYPAYDTATSTAGNINTLADADASTADKLAAGAELAGSLPGGKPGRNAAGGLARMADDAGDAARGVVPKPGTRVRPPGVPENWRVRPSDSPGGVKYYDPRNPGNQVRVEQGNPNSPHPNSREPYVRDLRDGQYRDAQVNVVPRDDPAGHIPLDQYPGYRP